MVTTIVQLAPVFKNSAATRQQAGEKIGTFLQ